MRPPPQFLTPLVTKPLPDGTSRQLVAALKFRDAQGGLHVVPTGFITDFASVPDLARIAVWLLIVIVPLSWVILWFEHWRCFIAVDCLIAFALWVAAIAHRLSGDPLIDAAAVVHDYEYRVTRSNRMYADLLLWQGMVATDRPTWKRVIIWGNVRLFGWKPWRDNGKVL